MSTENSRVPKTTRGGPVLIDGISYIPSSVLLAGIAKLSFKDNRAFGVMDLRGESPRAYPGGGELGLYFNDTRFLSIWEMTFNGTAPVMLSHDLRFSGNTLVISMTNQDLVALDGITRIPRDLLLIRRVLTLIEDVFHEFLIVRNFDHRAHNLHLEQWAGSHFEDIFEVRGYPRERRGAMLPPNDGLQGHRHVTTLSYCGLDDKIRTVQVDRYFITEVISLTPSLVGHATEITVPAKGEVVLRSVVSFDGPHDGTLGGEELGSLSVSQVLASAAERGRKSILMSGIQITTDNEIVNRSLKNAAADIQMLLTDEDQGTEYPYAGIPWFSAPFGRDGIITAYQALPWNPKLAQGVLHYVFNTLGTCDDPYTDAQPGKVFHEMRRGEMSQTREVPFVPYYGSVDSTPLALILLHEYVNWTKDLDHLREWWPAALRALSWMEHYGDADGDGFLEYEKRSPTGLPNQGWKDSNDSIMHADGRLAPSPIRLCEVQGYSYRAQMGMSALAQLLGESALAERLRLAALRLRARFQEEFWESSRGFVHLALDGNREACAVISSNMGQCLWGGILNPEQAESVTRHLMAEAMFNGYGIRTLADTEIAYNPMSYHNGSIWPHDNSLILEGLRGYGKTAEIETLAGGLVDVLEASHDFRLPELFCGFRRRGNEAPVPYEVACKPQAWAAGSLFLLVKSMLGLAVELDLPHLVVRSPVLPSRIKELEIKGLRGRDWELDLRFRRGQNGGAAIDILNQHGNVRVLPVRQSPSPMN